MKDSLWYDANGMIIFLNRVLANRNLASQVGHHHEIHKNLMNNEMVSQKCANTYPSLCAKYRSIAIVELAMQCGSKQPDNLCCVYQSDDEPNVFLTGDMITEYYHHVTLMVFPKISGEELRSFS